MNYIKKLFSCCFVKRREVPDLEVETINEGKNI